MRLRGCVALVTGASSGIGRAVAVRLVASGAHVFATGRNETALAAVSGATALVADLAEPSAPRWLARQVLEAAGRVDLLVSNAGVGNAAPFDEQSAAVLDQTRGRVVVVRRDAEDAGH